MNVRVRMKETSQGLVFENVKNTYTKGPLYCVYSDNKVVKIPLDNIWDIEESYN